MKRPHYMHVSMPAVLAHMKIRGLRLSIGMHKAHYTVITRPLVYGISVVVIRHGNNQDSRVETAIDKLAMIGEESGPRTKINIFYEEFERL